MIDTVDKFDGILLWNIIQAETNSHDERWMQRKVFVQKLKCYFLNIDLLRYCTVRFRIKINNVKSKLRTGIVDEYL